MQTMTAPQVNEILNIFELILLVASFVLIARMHKRYCEITQMWKEQKEALRRNQQLNEELQTIVRDRIKTELFVQKTQE